MIDFDDLNLKIALILAILILMSNLSIMLSGVEHEIFFIILGQGDTQTSLSNHRD